MVVSAEGDRSVDGEVPVGERLLDACDDLGAPVLFSCRTASCGVCRVHVLEGAKSFTHPSEEELEVLEIFEASADERLACQLVVVALPGDEPRSIRLQAVEAVPKVDNTP
ncbi:MAG: (2Fe-2S)-binding protein [Myxococcales bacterium]|nr:(2Fe-2S)-binding protein [Myxococcales bacterium]